MSRRRSLALTTESSGTFTTHPKFDLTGVRTHELQIMGQYNSCPEMLTLITENLQNSSVKQMQK